MESAIPRHLLTERMRSARTPRNDHPQKRWRGPMNSSSNISIATSGPVC